MSFRQHLNTNWLPEIAVRFTGHGIFLAPWLALPTNLSYYREMHIAQSCFSEYTGYMVFRGSLLRSLSDEQSHFLADALILVSSQGEDAGKIVAIGEASKVANEHQLNLERIEKQPGLWMPAFFDTHFHWVQDDVREMPKASLIEWLERYTFPEEANYEDREFAKMKAERFWKRIVSLGTVGGFCYSSIHEAALEEALKYAPEDFRIGNVLMTMNCPEAIRQSPAEAIDLVASCAARLGDRYVCSPRFAPTTAPEVMEASAQAARANQCFQQTHLGETRQEIDWVLGMYRDMPGFAKVESYTDIYRQVGMLGPKTIFGHCIYLDDTEWQLLAESGSRIASCPTSNAPIEELGLGSGLFDFPKAEAMKIPWALASDIGGGPFLSMFDVMRSFVAQNRAVGRSSATYGKALHRSTFKAAELMDLSNDRGRLAPGFYFDAIRVPLPAGAFVDGDGEPVLEALLESIPSRESTDTLVDETIIKGETRFRKEFSE